VDTRETILISFVGDALLLSKKKGWVRILQVPSPQDGVSETDNASQSGISR